MNELHLFAGAGGGILGGILLGHTTICAVEIEPYCRKVLLQRQRDGMLPKFPIWDDVRTFDGNPWRGKVDVVCGGFPCQDISAAGKGVGISGERSGLWSEMARIIGEVRPKYAFVENSPLLRKRGLAVVISDLARLGYASRWGVVRASDTGAPHRRARLWILAYSSKDGRFRSGLVQDQYRAEGTGRNETVRGTNRKRSKILSKNIFIPQQWKTEPAVDGMADGVAFHVDRLAATGNGQVPSVAALAWKILSEM